jgi:hypothetical protein
MFDMENFEDYIMKKICSYFDSNGFLNNTLYPEKYKYINFIKYKFNTIEEEFLMTEKCYIDRFEDFISWFQDKFYINDENCLLFDDDCKEDIDFTNTNVCHIHQFITQDSFDDFISEKRKNHFNRAIDDRFMVLLFEYWSDYKC